VKTDRFILNHALFFGLVPFLTLSIYAQTDCIKLTEALEQEYHLSDQSTFASEVQKAMSYSKKELSHIVTDNDANSGVSIPIAKALFDLHLGIHDLYDYLKSLDDNVSAQAKESLYQGIKVNLLQKFLGEKAYPIIDNCLREQQAPGGITGIILVNELQDAVVQINYSKRSPGDMEQADLRLQVLHGNLVSNEDLNISLGDRGGKAVGLSRDDPKDAIVLIVNSSVQMPTAVMVPSVAPTPPLPITPTQGPPPKPAYTDVVKTIQANVANWQGDVRIEYGQYALVTIVDNHKTWSWDNGADSTDGYGWQPIGMDYRPWPMRTKGTQYLAEALLARLDSQPPKSFSKDTKQLRFDGPGTIRFMMNDVWWHTAPFIPEVDVWNHDYPDGPPSSRDNGFDDNKGELDVLIRIYTVP
jgi:hypothetical protein